MKEDRAESPPPDAVLSIDTILQNPPPAPRKQKLSYTTRPKDMYDLTLAWPVFSEDDEDESTSQFGEKRSLPRPRTLFRNNRPIQSFFRSFRQASRKESEIKGQEEEREFAVPDINLQQDQRSDGSGSDDGSEGHSSLKMRLSL